MRLQLYFPPNGDTARFNVILSDSDMAALQNGQLPATRQEAWIGGSETPNDQLPVVVQVVHEAHYQDPQAPQA